MKRLDSMMLPELTKLCWQSRFLLVLGYCFFFSAFAMVLISAVMAVNEPTAENTNMVYIELCVALLLLPFGFQLVFVRSDGARKLMILAFFLMLASTLISLIGMIVGMLMDSESLSLIILMTLFFAVIIIVLLAALLVLKKNNACSDRASFPTGRSLRQEEI